VRANTGNLTVSANSESGLTATPDAYAIAAAIGFGGAAAGAGASGSNTATRSTKAFVRNGSDARAPVGLAKVEAHDRLKATADVNATSVSAGLVAFAAGVALAENTITSTTTASVEGSTVESGGGDLLIKADSVQGAADVVTEANAAAVAFGIGAAAVGARGVESLSSTVEAFASGSTLIAKDYLKIDAESNHAATPRVVGFSASLGVSISVAEAIGKVQGATRAYIDGASTVTVGNDVDITADSIASATPTGDSIAVGLAGGVGVAEFKAEVTRETAAYVGARAGEAAAGTAAVNIGNKLLNIKANATLTATADNFTGGFGLLAGGAVSKSTAIVNGQTLAYVGQGAQVSAGNVDIGAQSTDTATARNRVVSVAAGLGVKDARADATVSSRTEAFIGAFAGTVANTAAMGVNVGTSGTIKVDADSTMSATAESKGGGFAAGASLSFFKPTATVNGATRAYVREGVDIDAHTLKVTAGEAADKVVYTANATAFAVDISFGATVQDLEAVSSVSGVTEAFLGASRDTVGAGNPTAGIRITNTASPLTVSAVSDTDAVANVDGGGASLLVTVSSYKPTAEAGGATRAFVNDGVKLVGPNLKLYADGDARADADLFSLTLSAGASVGLLKPIATVNNHVEAYLGRGLEEATTDRADIMLSGAADVDAVGHSVAEATATGVAVALAVGVSDVNAVATLAGKTRAYIGKNTTLGATSVDLRAEELAAQAKALIESGAGGLIAAVTSLQPIAIGSRETAALVGDAAHVTLSGSLQATARTETGQPLADATISGGSGSLGISANVLKSTAIVGDGDVDGDGTNDDPDITGFTLAPSSTRAAIGNDAIVSASSITLDARSNTNAAAKVTAGSGAGLAAITATTINANSSHDTEATIGDGSRVTATNGALTLRAVGTTTASPSSTTGSGAGVINFQTTKIKTVVSSDTTVAIGGGGTITAQSLRLDARATHTATGAAQSGGGAGVANIASLDSRAEDKGSVNVRIGKAGDATGATITTSGSAGIDAGAKLTSNVRSEARATGFALIAGVQLVKTTALNESRATGYIGDNVNITTTGGGNFDLKVDLDGYAIGKATSVGGAAVEVKDSTTDVDFKAKTEITSGSGGRIFADGNVNIAGELNFDETFGTTGRFRTTAQGYGAIGDADNAGGGLASVQGGKVDVDANSTLNVSIGSGLSLTSNGGDINISGKHSNQAYGTLQNAGGGLVAVSTGTVTADATGSTTVGFQGHVDRGVANSANNLNVLANTESIATTNMSASSGGAVNVQAGSGSITATTNTTQTVNFAGTGSVMRLGGNINVSANLNTDADSATQAAGGGVVAVATLNPTANATGTVTFNVGNSDNVTAGGLLKLSANHGGAASPVSNGTIQSANGTTERIDFGLPHLLSTGAQVTFNGANGQGLVNGREYRVIVRSPNVISLGEVFGAAAVNTILDTITIQGHNFAADGSDVVIYQSGSSDVINGLVNGTSYRVKVIDENTIKLQGLSQNLISRQVTRSAVSNANETISFNNHGFGDGNAVTYRVQPVKEFAGNYIDAAVTFPAGQAPSVTFDGQNRIYIQGHGFTAGQELIYRGPGISYGAGVYFNGTTQVALPAGTITNGQRVFVVNSGLSTDYFRLALTLNDALGYTDTLGTPSTDDDIVRPPNPLNLFQGSSTALHSVRAIQNEPLELSGGGALVDGRTYYVVEAMPNTFKLALTSGGAALNFDIGATSGGSHTFAIEGMDFGDGGPASGQELLFDITSSLSGRFDGIGGAIGFASPSGGDGTVSASSTGGSGGGVNVQNSTAIATSTVATNLTVADGAHLKGNSVIIETNSRMGASATANGAGGGGIQIGEAGGRARGSNTSTITIGKAAIEAVGALTVQAKLDSDVVSLASSDGGGGIAVFIANASSDLDFGAKISVDGRLTAGDGLTVKTFIDNMADSQATGYGGGFGAGTDINADSFIDNKAGFKGSEISLLGNAQLTGASVALNSEIGRQKNRAYTDTVGGGVGGAALASSDARVSSNNEINLAHGSTIIGGKDVLIEAKYDGTDNNARSKARFYALGGYSRARGTADLVNNAKIEGYWEAIIKTARLDVNVLDSFVSSNHRASGDAGGVYIGPADSETQRNTPVLTSNIFWEAHVYLLGEPNPELVVDQTGRILKLTNIEFLGANAGKDVDDTLVGPIVLKDISYDVDKGKVKFFANSIPGASASNIWGNRGVFEIQRTWDTVRIENNSALDLVVNLIDVVLDTVTVGGFNPADIEIQLQNVPGPTDTPLNNVSLNPAVVGNTFEFDVFNNWVRTVVDILNLQPDGVAPSDIILDGRIENPIGITNIRNQRGNVLADPDADVELIRTNEIDIEATGGSIGTVGGDANGAVGSTPRTPLAVELVRFQDAAAPQLTPSMAPNTIFEPDLRAEATGDTVLDLYYMDRADASLGGDFSQTAVIRKITAGDDVSVVVNDMREGIGKTGVGVVTVADRGFTVDLRTVANHFRPDDVPGPDYANILRAFGTDFVEIDSTWVFSEVRAGDDIDIGHVTTTAAFGEPRSYATTSIGGTPYGATVTPETPNTTVNLVVNTDVAWTGGSSDDDVPQIFLTTNGNITATELVGDMLVGHIHSTAGDVTLVSGRRILDADGLPTIDVTGVNITMTSGAVTPETPFPRWAASARRRTSWRSTSTGTTEPEC
jgi:hypothetical protein